MTPYQCSNGELAMGQPDGSLGIGHRPNRTSTPCSYYVSVMDAHRGVLALGPFSDHSTALQHVRPFRAWLRRHSPNADCFTVGTIRRHSSEPGKWNELYQGRHQP